MIKLYTLPNCTICEELRSYMRNNHIAYEEANVANNPRALAKMANEGINNFPAVEINGVIYSGNVNELKKIVSL